LSDLAGAVKAWRLSFSIEDFIRRALDENACSSPVNMSAAGTASEPQTIVVAHGRELDAVRAVLKRNATLQHIEVAAGNDPRSITLHKRIEGLTVDAIPTFRDGLRAAAKYPKPGTFGVSAWESLGTSGYVLGAYERSGWMPLEWTRPKHTTARPQVIEAVAAGNGEVGAANIDDSFER
jgi:hypothetical protein